MRRNSGLAAQHAYTHFCVAVSEPPVLPSTVGRETEKRQIQAPSYVRPIGTTKV